MWLLFVPAYTYKVWYMLSCLLCRFNTEEHVFPTQSDKLLPLDETLTIACTSFLTYLTSRICSIANVILSITVCNPVISIASVVPNNANFCCHLHHMSLYCLLHYWSHFPMLHPCPIYSTSNFYSLTVSSCCCSAALSQLASCTMVSIIH
jgi:hypothetical protein